MKKKSLKGLCISFVLPFLFAGQGAYSQGTCNAAFTYSPDVSTICVTTSISVTFTGTVPNSIHLWSFGPVGDPNAIVTSDPSPTIDFEPGIYVAKHTVSNISGTNSCTDTKQDTLVIYENISPAFADVSAGSVTGKHCTGEPVQFLSNTGVSASHYWEFPGGTPATSTESNPLVVFSSEGIFTVKHIVTNGPCVTEVNQNVVITQLDADFTNSDLSCITGLVTFTSTETNVDHAWTVNPKGGNATPVTPSASDMQNPAFTFNSSGTYEVRHIVSDDGFCPDTVTKIITVSVNPNPDFLYKKSDECSRNGEVLFFSYGAGLSATEGPLSHFWDFGDPASGAANTSTEEQPTHIFSSYRLFTVSHIITSVHGCSSSKQLLVFPESWDASFTFTDNCSASNILFENVKPSSGQHLWTFAPWTTSSGIADPPVSIFDEPIISFSRPGQYLVTHTVLVSNGCKDVVVKSIFVGCSGRLANPDVTEPVSEEGLFLFPNVPNPYEGFTEINYSLPEDKHGMLQITDISGRTVREIYLEPGTSSVSFHADDLEPGIYFYRLISGDQASPTFKMILSK